MSEENKLTAEPNTEADSCTFLLTCYNERILNALCKYGMMLDFVTKAGKDEQLSIDGLLNSLLLEAMTKRVKDLVKKHCFEDADEFIDCVGSCEDGEEVTFQIKSHEMNFFKKTHEEILSHMPVLDKQNKLPF